MQNSPPKFDVAVIGAGPAGSSAAITAARLGARVVLLRLANSHATKSAGSLFLPNRSTCLRDLFVLVPGRGSVLSAAPVINQVRLMLELEASMSASVAPPALSISRYDLDALLWEAAQQAGVERGRAVRSGQLKAAARFIIDTSQGAVAATAVIVAAGRWSRFTGVGAHSDRAEVDWRESPFSRASSHRTPPTYIFSNMDIVASSPLRTTSSTLARWFAPTLRDSLEEVFALHPALAERRRRLAGNHGAREHGPADLSNTATGQNNLLFAGDAAAFIDPFVGDGISIALRTGQFAATSLVPFLSESCFFAADAACRIRLDLPPAHRATDQRRFPRPPASVVAKAGASRSVLGVTICQASCRSSSGVHAKRHERYSSANR